MGGLSFRYIQRPSRVRKTQKDEESQRVLDKLDSYLNEAENEPMQFLVRFWKAQAAVITYQELRSLILNEEASKNILDDWFRDYAIFTKKRMTPLWEKAILAGKESNQSLKNMDGFVFNTSEKAMRLWILNHSAEFVTNCTTEQRETIRYLVAESVQHQMSTEELARFIRPTIGLTRPQEAANLRYYANVKEQLQKQHPTMRKETVERRAREASVKYAEKQHRARATMIARTEVATAYHRGNDEAVRQAIAQNFMPEMKKVWSTSRDDRVCHICRALEGVEVGMNDEFKVKAGRNYKDLLLPPAHPHCACAVKYVEVKEAK